MNPFVTLWPSRVSRDNWRRKGNPEQPFQYQACLYEYTSQIHSYGNYTLRSSACWNRLLAPWCAHAQNECHVISSPDIDLHILMTNNRSMQDHIAKFTQQNAHTWECIKGVLQRHDNVVQYKVCNDSVVDSSPYVKPLGDSTKYMTIFPTMPQAQIKWEQAEQIKQSILYRAQLST